MKDSTRSSLKILRQYVDGDADTLYEYIMLMVTLINTVSIGLETSKSFPNSFVDILSWIDRGCFFFFLTELLFKGIVYNRNFFGEERKDEKGNSFYFINWWNISDLIIVILSAFSELACFFDSSSDFSGFAWVAVFRVFRLFRVVRVFKIINEFSSLRSILRGLVKALPGIFATFCFLALFAYVYGVIGTNLFTEKEFSQWFGDLGRSILTMCQMLTLDSWFSGITRIIMEKHPWAWVYFVSYVFVASLVIMNAIVGIIVDSMAKERERQRDDETEVTLERLSDQIEELKKTIELHEEHYEEYITNSNNNTSLLRLIRKPLEGKLSAPLSSITDWRSSP